jgi:hypothetical protein
MINPHSAERAANFTATAGGTCTGSGPYAALTAGTPITVRDAVGKVIAISRLGVGQDRGIGGCVFTWQAPNVPSERMYGVQISQLGVVDFPKGEVGGGFNTAIGN